MKAGDKVQYNKRFNSEEVCLILATNGNHALVQFPNGTKICTRLSGLYTINNN